jgi:molecular chaperone DnaJ
VFRLRGRGVRSTDGYGRGDLHARVIVEMPSGLSSKQKKLIKEFHEAGAPENYPQHEAMKVRVEAFYARKQEISR